MFCSHCARLQNSGETNDGWLIEERGLVITCPACREVLKAKHDPVNHPKHYTSHPSGVECITITRHMPFNIGNAIKYLWRAGQKDSEIQDLEKAVWYIKDEIQRLQGKNK